MRGLIMKEYLTTVCLVLLLPAFAAAEYRTIAVEVARAKDKSAKVTIHSEAKAEKKTAISIAEATEILEKVTGWGSGVGVAVVIDGVQLKDYLPLLQAIAENIWLDLTVIRYRQDRGSHILKYYGIEPVAARDKE